MGGVALLKWRHRVARGSRGARIREQVGRREWRCSRSRLRQARARATVGPHHGRPLVDLDSGHPRSHSLRRPRRRARRGGAAHARADAVAGSDGAPGSRRRLRQDRDASLRGAGPRSGRLGLCGSGRGAPEPARGPGLRPPGRLRAGQPRGGLPDPRARRLAGQDGVHRALLRAQGERYRAGGGPPGQDDRLRGSGVELRLHLSRWSC